MRWPRQQVMKVLSARTPRSSGSPTRRRACAGRRRGSGTDRADGPGGSGPCPSIGSPWRDDAAEPAFGRADGAGGGRNDRPAAAPHALPAPRTAIASACLPAKPTTSQGIAARYRLDGQPGADDMAWMGLHFDHQPAHADHAAVTSAPSISTICSASAFMVQQTGADGRLIFGVATAGAKTGKRP